MNELKFVQLQKDDEELFEMAKEVWLPFIREVHANDGKEEPDDQIIDGLKKRIGIQGARKGMHFEIALLEGEVIGISMFAIDLGTIYGLLDEPGYGTVMGFYIKPAYRRRGYGRRFFGPLRKHSKRTAPKRCTSAPTG